MKNLKKILAWFLICIAVTVAIKLGGWNLDATSHKGVVMGTETKNPGFGPLLEASNKP